MKRECGGCDSRVARRFTAAPRSEFMYRKQSGSSEIDGGREAASEGLEGLEPQGEGLEPQGESSSSHQSAHPPCSCIGIPGGVLSEAMANCVRAEPKAFSLHGPLAGTGFRTNQLGCQAPHSVDKIHRRARRQLLKATYEKTSPPTFHPTASC